MRTRNSMLHMLITNSVLVLSGGVAFAQTFPSDRQWITLKYAGVDLHDPVGDTARGEQGARRDNVSSTDASVYVWSDGTYFYLRLRVAGDPMINAGGNLGFGWGCQISTGTAVEYEYMALIDGKIPAVRVWANTKDNDLTPGDKAETLISSYGGDTFATVARSVPLGADFFVDFVFPIADLPGVTLTSPLQFVCGSNSNGAPVLTTGHSADTINDAAGTSWEQIASDPITLGCDTFPCPEGKTTPICSNQGTCVGCTDDSQCGGSTPACQRSGRCGQCSATNDDLCVAPTPVCDVDDGVCVGCVVDSDCPSGSCHQQTHMCVPGADAGVPDTPLPADAGPEPLVPIGVIEGGGCDCRVGAEGRTPAISPWHLLTPLGLIIVIVIRRRSR